MLKFRVVHCNLAIHVTKDALKIIYMQKASGQYELIKLCVSVCMWEYDLNFDLADNHIVSDHTAKWSELYKPDRAG